MQSEDREGIEGTVWQVLRKIYVRAITGGEGGGLNEAQENSLLDKHHKAMEHDLAVLMTCVDQGRAAGLSAVAARLKAAEVIKPDHFNALVYGDE